MERQDIVGRWIIVDWVQYYDDGRVTYPLGEALGGFVQYEPDGRMVSMVAGADRPAFATSGQ